MIEREEIWFVMSAIAGTITALAQMKYKQMTWSDIGLTLFSGFGFAVFFMPLVAHRWLGIAEHDTQATNAMVYIGGTGWNILLPFAIQRIKAVFGTKEAV